MIGTIIADKYRILAPIAKGGMGRIYRALQMPLEREVALKILDVGELREATGRDDVGDDFQRRFFLEAASAAKLSHPNTVIIYDYGRAGPDAYYIAMEYVAGPTLGEVIDAEAPLAPERVEHIAIQIAGSIGEAHGADFIHRDLKPTNVILAERADDPDFAKVLDFGLVKRRNEDVSMTQSGALVGTPRYMSPEQIACAPVGPTTDIYSLGALMYHALTGRPPFDSESKFVLMAAHMNVEPPSMSEAVEGLEVPPALEAIVMRCLRKSPLERYASMRELATALRDGVPGAVDRTVSGVGRKGTPASVGALGSSPRPGRDSGVDTLVERGAGPARRRKLGLGLGLLLTGALVVGLSSLLSGEREERAAPPLESPAPRARAEPAPPPEAQPALAQPAASAELGAIPERLVVETIPPNARVQHEGVDLGDAPVTLLILEGERWVLDVSARGYLPRQVTVTGGQETARVRLLRRRRAPATEAAPDRRTDNRNPWAR